MLETSEQEKRREIWEGAAGDGQASVLKSSPYPMCHHNPTASSPFKKHSYNKQVFSGAIFSVTITYLFALENVVVMLYIMTTSRKLLL